MREMLSAGLTAANDNYQTLLDDAVQMRKQLSAAQEAIQRLRGALREMRSQFGRTLPCNDPACLVCPDEINVTREADAALAETADPPQEPAP